MHARLVFGTMLAAVFHHVEHAADYPAAFDAAQQLTIGFLRGGRMTERRYLRLKLLESRIRRSPVQLANVASLLDESQRLLELSEAAWASVMNGIATQLDDDAPEQIEPEPSVHQVIAGAIDQALRAYEREGEPGPAQVVLAWLKRIRSELSGMFAAAEADAEPASSTNVARNVVNQGAGDSEPPPTIRGIPREPSPSTEVS